MYKLINEHGMEQLQAIIDDIVKSDCKNIALETRCIYMCEDKGWCEIAKSNTKSGRFEIIVSDDSWFDSAGSMLTQQIARQHRYQTQSC